MTFLLTEKKTVGMAWIFGQEVWNVWLKHDWTQLIIIPQVSSIYKIICHVSKFTSYLDLHSLRSIIL